MPQVHFLQLYSVAADCRPVIKFWKKTLQIQFEFLIVFFQSVVKAFTAGIRVLVFPVFIKQIPENEYSNLRGQPLQGKVQRLLLSGILGPFAKVNKDAYSMHTGGKSLIFLIF